MDSATRYALQCVVTGEPHALHEVKKALATDGEWWTISDNVLALARALDEAGQFPDVKTCIYFFSKPWKYSPEWAYFDRHKTMEGWPA